MEKIYKIILFFIVNIILFASNQSFAQKKVGLSFEIDSVLVTAQKAEQNIDDVIIKIDTEKEYQNTSLPQILNLKSNIYIKKYGAGQLSSISLNGFGATQTNINWNGVKLNSPMLGQTDLNLIQIGNNDKLSLNTKNADNIAGALDLSQEIVFKPRNELSFGASVGSFVSSSGNLSYLYASKRWYFSTLVSYQAAKNNFLYSNPSLPDNQKTNQINAEAKLLNIENVTSYRLNSRNRIAFFVKYFRADRNLPPSLFETNATENQKDQLALGKFSWHHKYLKLETEFNSAFVYQEIKYQFAPNTNLAISKANSWQSNFKLIDKFSDEFEYQADLSYEYETGQSTNYTEIAQRHKIVFDNEIIYNNKYFVSSLGFSEMLVAGKLSPFLPKAKLIFKFSNLPADIVFVVDYSSKLRYPSLNELYWTPGGNINLKPETSQNINLNIDIKRSLNRISFENKFEYFNIWANNYIQWNPTTNIYWIPKNIGSVYSRGFNNNLNINLKYTEDISLDLNFDYTFTQISRLKSLRQLIYVPYSQFNFGSDFKSKWINFGFNHHYTGKRFTDDINLNALQTYYLLDFNANKTLKFKNKDALNIGVSLNNITNQKYFQVLNRPLPGFNFECSLKYNLNFIK